MAELQIKIGADVTSAVQGLNQVGTELEQTSRDANAFSNSVDKASAKLRALPNVTGQATSTLTNFSRVVQDAPYGIIGIANNIDPLVQSFNQLKVSTGSTTGAFKALIGQLAGPAGIALGISLVTSLLVKYSDKLFGASQASKDLAEQSKKAAEAQQSILERLGSERAEIDKLILLIKSENTTRAQKEVILKKLQQISPQYFGDLRNEAGLVDKLTEAYKKYTASLVARSEVAVLSKELEDLSTEILKLEKAGANTKVIDLGLKQGLDGRLQVTRLLTKEETAQLTLNTKYLSALRERQRILDEIAKRQVAPFVPPTSPVTQSIATRALINIPTEGILPQVQKAAEKIQSDIKPIKINAGLDLTADSRLSESAKANREYIKSVQDDFNRFSENINKAIANIQIEGLTSIAQGIGEALVTGNIGDAFKSFGSVIASGLEVIGKQLIAISGVAKLAQEALTKLFTNPGLALAVGIGLVAAGSALRASLNSGIKARALGGPVSGGEPYLVGERGPELFVPSVSGGIVPNNSVGGFMGGRMGSGGGSSVLRGQDILLAYARTQRSQLRVNG